jgi:Delta3-Delta2-enoyl-CoA isomerase
MEKFPKGLAESIVEVTVIPDTCYLLQFELPPDNRLEPVMLDGFYDALTWIEHQEDALPLVTTSKIEKFYSNGLNFEKATSTEGFFTKKFYRTLLKFLEFPYPTIALVNGHAFAGGFMLAAHHDYIVMNPNKGFLCINEVQFGAPLLPPMAALFRIKYGTLMALKAGLTAHRYNAQEAFKLGIVHALGGLEEAKQLALKVKPFSTSPSYSSIRSEILAELVSVTKNFQIANPKL